MEKMETVERMEGFVMKRFVSIMLMIVLFTTWTAPLAFAEENGVQLAENVKSAILIERDTGESFI